jgi:hypothetical protein
MSELQIPKIFSSGSCRLITTIGFGFDKLNPIHSNYYERNFYGPNFLGKLHDIKQHIQFIKWIKDEIDLPIDILESFLTAYSKKFDFFKESGNKILQKKYSIKDQFDNCDIFLFEISSIKLYTRSGFSVNYEHTNEYEMTIQNSDELYNDLKVLQSLIPDGKRIIIQTHFRPNIIYEDETKRIEKREIIYNTVSQFCNDNKNVLLFDPSILLSKNQTLFDGDCHFNKNGHNRCFDELVLLCNKL